MDRAAGWRGWAGLDSENPAGAGFAVGLLAALRKAGARFTVSVPRTEAMWKLIAQIPRDAWSDALDLAGAQVAQIAYTPAEWKHEPLRMIVRRTRYTAAEISINPRAATQTIHPEQLALLLGGQASEVYGYSFILTDIAEQTAVGVEHFHRHRAQIEERLKDAKRCGGCRLATRTPTAPGWPPACWR